MKIQGRTSLRNGDLINVEYNKNNLHLFDKDSEQTILNLDNL